MSTKSAIALERPLKFDIQTEMQYRIHGEKQWQKGQTVTISTTEILFQGTSDLKLGAVIDIQYVLPILPRRVISSRVRCQGEVLRTSEGSITAKLAHCRLVRG